MPRQRRSGKDYVTKTESKTVSETKISNDPNQMDRKTESDPIFTPTPKVAENYLNTTFMRWHAEYASRR